MESNDSLVTITFHPQEKVTRVPPGMSVFNAANWIGLAIDSTCGGLGTCGKCKIRVLKGSEVITAADRKALTDEDLASGWRLSCRAEAYSDLVCEVPRLMGNPKAALMGFGRHVVLEPNVHKVVLQLEPPTLSDQRSDFVRVQHKLLEEGYEVIPTLSVLRQLPTVLRTSDWHITAVVIGQELATVEPGDTRSTSFGLTFDLGTTTVVGALLDLESGAVVSVKSILNEQAVFGADVIARISHTMMETDGLMQMRNKALQSLNQLISQLCQDANVSTNNVYEAVIAGNATMLHLLLGLDPEALGVTPFVPVVDNELTIHAQTVGLDMYSESQIHFLPHIGAYVGADLVSGLLATGLAHARGVRLLVDVGTNGEIIIGSEDRVVATAAPAGPAFEGAQIHDGMRASEGAIEAVEINSHEIKLKVIGDCDPVGLCGSGLVDAVAQARITGLLDATGRFLTYEKATNCLEISNELIDRIITFDDGMLGFVLAWEHETQHGRRIILSQRDIRELQFAKAAIASGIDVVMRELGVDVNDLQEIFLAGSFGSYINPQSARVIGLVPPISVKNIKAVGNAAGEGAKIALLSFRQRNIAYELPRFVEYHELSGRADFNDAFIDVLNFPDLLQLGIE